VASFRVSSLVHYNTVGEVARFRETLARIVAALAAEPADTCFLAHQRLRRSVDTRHHGGHEGHGGNVFLSGFDLLSSVSSDGGEFLAIAHNSEVHDELVRSPRLGRVRSVTLASPAFAQVSTFDLSGTVLDPSSACCPAATITLRNTKTGLVRTEVADERGRYHSSRCRSSVNTA